MNSEGGCDRGGLLVAEGRWQATSWGFVERRDSIFSPHCLCLHLLPLLSPFFPGPSIYFFRDSRKVRPWPQNRSVYKLVVGVPGQTAILRWKAQKNSFSRLKDSPPLWQCWVWHRPVSPDIQGSLHWWQWLSWGRPWQRCFVAIELFPVSGEHTVWKLRSRFLSCGGNAILGSYGVGR